VTEVLYRKWRPQSFAEVAGQEAITRTLRNSIAAGSLSHAYLFCGPRGTGKTTLGRLLAKAANCTAPADGEPCNKCESCLAFIEGRAMDFVEQDAASHNSVEDIRQLRENVGLTPMSGGRKVYLLDEVHMLSTAAQNALLKTLEEPPPHIIFVLATTDAHKVQPTIMSRCQRFDLKRIPVTVTVARLRHISEQEGFTLAEESLEEIARSSTGSLRDAVNGLEQVVTYYGRSPTPGQVRDALGLNVDARSGQLAALLMAGDLTESLRLVSQVRDDGVDMKQFARQLVKYLRGMLLAKAGAAESLELSAETAAEVRAQAAEVSLADIIRALSTFGRIDFKEDSLASLPLELAVVEYLADAGEAVPVAKREIPGPRREVPVERPAKPVASELRKPPAEKAVEADGVATTAASERPSGSVKGGAAPANGDLLTRVRAALRESDRKLDGLLNGSCEVVSSEGEKVVLGFFHTFHLERAEYGSNKQALEKAFSAELGRPVKISLEHTPREPRAEKPKGGHLVEAARQMGAKDHPQS
jgi:DNA polymerase-3 subunit gamma/tau